MTSQSCVSAYLPIPGLPPIPIPGLIAGVDSLTTTSLGSVRLHT